MIIPVLYSFAKNASNYLRKAKTAEPGHSQAIRAHYARIFLNEIGMELTGPSKEEIEAIGPCIYVANHTSNLDPVIICACFEGDLRILAKESLFKVPWLKRILILEKHIKVCRGKNASARNAAIRDNIKQTISEGGSVLFFPEGTRSPDGKLAKFRLGAFFNAIQTNVPIVPIVIKGAYEALPKKAGNLNPGPCSLTILPKISLPDESEGDELKRVEMLANQASQAISEFQKAHE